MTVNLSTANKSYIEKAATTKQTTTNPIVSSENTSETKTIDKKKLACSIGAALGAVALTATVIHFIKKGNVKGAKEASAQFEKGIKKFFNGETLVDGVKLEKGKALNADGSAFSGVMKTMSKNGSTVAIEYADGFMKSSTKNGKLVKTFDEFGKGLSRKQGVHITKYLEDGKTQDIYETFYDSGKLKKLVKPDMFDFGGTKHKAFRAKQYSEKGVLTAETFIDSDKNKFLAGNFFDKDGKLESSIGAGKRGLDKKVYSKDGIIAKKFELGEMSKEKNVFSDNISSDDYVMPRSMSIFNQDGNLARQYETFNEDFNIYITQKDVVGDNSHWWGVKLPETENIDSASKDIIRLVKDGEKISFDGTETMPRKISKKDAEQMIEKAKEILGVAKDNGLMDRAFSEAQDVGLSEFANQKRYEDIIKQFEEYVKKL